MLDDPSYRCTLLVFWPLLYCYERYQIHTHRPNYFLISGLVLATFGISSYKSFLRNPFYFNHSDYFALVAIGPIRSTHILSQANEDQLVTSLTSQM